MSNTHQLPQVVNTQRCLLRLLRLSDAQSVFDSYASDARVARYTSWKPHKHVEETERFIARVLADASAGRSAPFIVTLKTEPSLPIGVFEANVDGSTVDFGYVLSRRTWGNGFASEILTSLVELALSQPGIYRAQAFCNTENVASARVMEKAGLTLEGRIRRHFVYPNISNEPGDSFLYARVR